MTKYKTLNKVMPGVRLQSAFPDDEEAQEWFSQAACADKDPNIFFPILKSTRPGGNAKMMTEAISICNTCPVRGRCLDAALISPWEPWGVMGGLTPGHLVMLRKELRRKQLRKQLRGQRQ